MRAIEKRQEPASLTAHRSAPGASYVTYADRDGLRRALVTEQRGLCCYCMGRIAPDPRSAKIEHWHSRTRYPAEELAYRNLLGACRGGEGQPRHLQHCDTRKGNRDLKWNPADPIRRIEKRVRYGTDGAIRSDDVEFDDQLTDVLNLNLSWLKNSRKGVLDGVLGWWKQKKVQIQGPVPRATLRRKRDKQIAVHGDLSPYCQVAVWWIDQRLARVSA